MRVLLACLLVRALAPAVAHAERDGLTVEIHGGAGAFYMQHGGADNELSSTDPSALALHAGIGGFVTPWLAISGTLVTSTYLHDEPFGDHVTQTVTAVFVGPSAQLWLTPQLWLGGGVGLSTLSLGDMPVNQTSVGFDLRAGMAFPLRRRGVLSVSAEATPASYDGNWIGGASLLVGYQYL